MIIHLILIVADVVGNQDKSVQKKNNNIYEKSQFLRAIGINNSLHQ